MAGPLRTTYEAMPDPKVVIAAGTDAVSGGLLGDGEATTGGVAPAVPVDIWLPGSPPSPFGILNALLIAVGKLVGGGGSARAGGGRSRAGAAAPAAAGGAVSGLFAAGLILLAAAAAADLAALAARSPYVLGAAGSACLAVLGGFALAGRTVRLPVAGLARAAGARAAVGCPVRRPAVGAVPGHGVRRRRAGVGGVRQLGRRPGGRPPGPPAHGGCPPRTPPRCRLRAGPRRGRGDRNGAGRVHRPVRVGGADDRVLLAGGFQPARQARRPS